MGLLTNDDAKIFRNYFKEMAKLIGITVMYQFPIDMKFSLYAEEDPTGFSPEQSMDIIFEENPKINTLRKYGWVSESAEDKPYLAHLPYDAENLCKGCRILIPSPFPTNKGRLFVVTDITANLQYPDCWVCKLAPVMHDKPAEPVDYSDTNYNFLKVKK